MVCNSVFVPSPPEGGGEGGRAVMVNIILREFFALRWDMYVPFIYWLHVMLLTAVQGAGKGIITRYALLEKRGELLVVTDTRYII